MEINRLHMRDHNHGHSLMQHVMHLRASWLLRPSIRYSTPTLSGREAVTNRFSHTSASDGALRSDAQSTVTSEDGSRTLRSRRHENKSLPLPVLMDPILQEAKQKYHAPKPRLLEAPTEAALDFKRKLAKNVHAQALATKVRQCQVTRARLPDHFLIPFIAEMPHLGNARECDDAKSADRVASKSQNRESKGPTLVPAVGLHNRGTPSSYLLATKEALDHTFSKKGKSQIIVSDRMKKRYSAHIGQSIEKASADWLDKTRKAWPAEQHTPDTILATLRRRFVDNIAWCAKEQDESIPGTGLMCQTVLGSVNEVQDDDLEEDEDQKPPPRILYVENSSSYYNAAGEHVGRPREEMEEVEYDLLKLLGPELCEELKEKHLGEWRDDRAPILIRHVKSVKAILALEKLRNYLESADERNESR